MYAIRSYYDCPYPTGANAGTNPTADTEMIIGDVFESALFFLDTADSAFGAGFQTHGAITAGFV